MGLGFGVLYKFYIGMMEKKMEATIWGFVRFRSFGSRLCHNICPYVMVQVVKLCFKSGNLRPKPHSPRLYLL